MLLKIKLKKLFLTFLVIAIFTGILSLAYSQDTNFIDLEEPINLDLNFQQLSMEDAVKMAILNNPKISIQQALVEQKKWAIKEQKSYLYPQLYVYQDYIASNNPVSAFMMKLSQRNFNFATTNLNYPGTESNFSTRVGGNLTILDRSLYKKIDISKVELEIQKQIGKKDLYDLVQEVRKAYLDVKIAQESVLNAQASLEAAKEHYRAVELKKEHGTASKSDYLGAKVKLFSSEEEQAKAKNNLNLAWITLADIVGEDNIIGYDLTDRMQIDIPVDDIDKLVKYAYLHHPEISSVELGKDRALLELKLAKKTGAMTLKAHGEWGVDTILDDRNIARGYTAGVFLNKSIFDGGLRKAKIEQAKSDVNRMDAEIDQKYKKVKLEVVQNYLNLVNAVERHKMTNSLVEDAEESSRAYSERYAVGLSNSVEVENAQLKLSNARLLRTHALYDLNLAAINLQQSIGMPLSHMLTGLSILIIQDNPAKKVEPSSVQPEIKEDTSSDQVDFNLQEKSFEGSSLKQEEENYTEEVDTKMDNSVEEDKNAFKNETVNTKSYIIEIKPDDSGLIKPDDSYQKEIMINDQDKNIEKKENLDFEINEEPKKPDSSMTGSLNVTVSEENVMENTDKSNSGGLSENYNSNKTPDNDNDVNVIIQITSDLRMIEVPISNETKYNYKKTENNMTQADK